MPMKANLVELQAVRDAVADHAVCMFSTLGMIQGRGPRRSFLRHAARIVRPGGTLVLHVHRRWAALRERGGWGKLLGNRLRSLYRRDVEFGDAVYAYRGLENMFLHRFAAREIRGDLRHAGWRTERLERVDLRGEQLAASTWHSGGWFVVARRVV
jgi:SAM-dependent methyltransferase